MRMPLSSKAKQVNGIESINVFIAYRQGQGDDRAAQLHVLLNKTTIEIEDGKQAQLSVYWDRAAPTIDDFRRVWKGHLRTARAFILVCSPGTRQRRDKGQDWLFDEIEWWAANRRTGPILIDAMGGGEADVPAVILRKWPFAQRALLGDDDALRERIVQGIVLSERGVRYQELVRLRRLSLTLLGLLIVAVSLGFATFEFSRQAQQRAVRAESNLLVAESRGVKETDPTLAYLIAEEAFRHDPDNEQAYRNLLAAYYDADAFYTILTRDPNPPFGTTRPIYSFSEFLSKKSLLVASLYRPGELRIFSLDGTLEKTWALDHEADFAEISPDGKHVLTSRDFSRQVHLLDSQGQYIRSFNFADAVESVRFSPDGKSILVGAGNNAYLWDLNNDTASVVFKGHTNHLNDVEFSSDGRFVLTAGDKTARIWDRDGGMLRVLEHPDYVTSVAMYVGETTTRIATTCWDQLVRLWFENGELIKTYSGHDSRVYSATFSPDGKYLASASWDGTIRIWHGTSIVTANEKPSFTP